jgi:hypothetical protein
LNQKNPMDVPTPVVQEFFEQYTKSRSAADIDRIVSQYADSCMLGHPNGALVADRQAFLEGFPKAMELLKTVGHTSTTLASLRETEVDEHYVMVRAQVVWRFEKAVAPAIDVTVDSTFILYIKGAPKIVFQHEREDLWQVLRTRGVLPAQG